MSINQHEERWCGWGTVAAAFIVYLVTCCRTVAPGDSGELTLALTTGGIAHPPGYPLYTILGFLWLKLLFFLRTALAANLFSAAATAAAAGVVYRLLRRLSDGEASPLVSSGCALLFAFSHAIWSSATVAEVYGLSALLYVVALYLTVIYSQDGRRTALYAAAFSCGLTLAHHFSSAVVIAALLIAAFMHRRELSARIMTTACGFFLLPLTLYLYLLLRFDPALPVNWMAAKSAAGLWGMFSADIYRQFVGLPTPGDVVVFLGITGSYLLAVFGPGMALISLAGIPAVIRGQKRPAMIILLPALLNLAMVSTYRIPDYEGYLVPTLVAVLFLIHTGVNQILLRFVAKQWLLPMTAAVLVLWPLLFNIGRCTMNDFTLAERYGRDLLESAPPQAMVFLKSDNGSHPALYLHYAEKVRPDLAVYSTNSTLARLKYRFRGNDYAGIVDSLDRTTTSVYRGAEYIVNQGVPPASPDRELTGFLYGPGGTQDATEARILAFAADSLDAIDLKGDLKAEQIYLEYRLLYIDRLFRSGDGEALRRAVGDLRDWGKSLGDPHTCLAVAQFFRGRGLTDEAIAWVDLASAAHPMSSARCDIFVSQASIYRQQGELSRAAAALEAALQINPSSSTARYNLYLLQAEAALEKQDLPEALRMFGELTRLDPENPLPYFNMAVIYDRLPGKEREALGAYTDFVKRAGGQYSAAVRKARQRIAALMGASGGQ